LNEATEEVDDAERTKKVAVLMKKQHEKYKKALDVAKKAAVDRNMTLDQKKEMKAVAAKEQKKMIALQKEVTKQEEKKVKAQELAEEQAQEEEDKRNAVPLEPEEKVKLYSQIRKVTFVRPSRDIKINIKQKREAITRAVEL
jgi:hypothetical protein